MAPHPKVLYSYYYFPSEAPHLGMSPAVKLKTMVRAHVLSCVFRVARAVAKAKAKVVEELLVVVDKMRTKEKRRNKKKKMFGCIRSVMCCSEWPSSHIMPELQPSAGGHGHRLDSAGQSYCDESTWSSVIPTSAGGEGVERQLSGYLHWLEEGKKGAAEGPSAVAGEEEIDRLAERFIAQCHEKFRLEKQESYRRYHEMLARST